MTRWRIVHTAFLWVVARVGFAVVTIISMMATRPALSMSPTLDDAFRSGLDIALLMTALVTSLMWIDNRRMHLGSFYSNLGFNPFVLHLLSAVVVIVLEAAFTIGRAVLR